MDATTTTKVEQLSIDDLWRGLEDAGAIDDLGLVPEKLGDLTFDEWAAIGVVVGKRNSAVRWIIGDWINYGESTYGESIWQASDATGLRDQTIKNYAWVSGSVARSRRRDTLSWSHHEAVASLTPREQRTWLSRAEREGWNVDQLRDARASEKGEPSEPADGEETPKLTVAEAARQVWISSSKEGDAYRTPVETMLRLARAIGEPV